MLSSMLFATSPQLRFLFRDAERAAGQALALLPQLEEAGDVQGLARLEK